MAKPGANLKQHVNITGDSCIKQGSNNEPPTTLIQTDASLHEGVDEMRLLRDDLQHVIVRFGGCAIVVVTVTGIVATRGRVPEIKKDRGQNGRRRRGHETRF